MRERPRGRGGQALVHVHLEGGRQACAHACKYVYICTSRSGLYFKTYACVYECLCACMYASMYVGAARQATSRQANYVCTSKCQPSTDECASMAA